MGNDSTNNSVDCFSGTASELVDGVTAACARSIAESAGLQVSEQIGIASSKVVARGDGDEVALKQRYHDAHVHRRFKPADALGCRLYALMERERYEALGANRFKGVGQNLDACWRFRNPASADSQADADSRQDVSEGYIAGLCRRAFRIDFDGDFLAPAQALDESGLAHVDDQWLERLGELINDQAAFSSLAAKAALQLARGMAAASGLESTVDADAEMALETTDESLNDAEDESAAELDDAAASDVDSEAEDAAAEGQGDSEHTDELPDTAMDEAPTAGPDPNIVVSGNTKPYRAYTTDFDEVELASQWADSEQLAQWREELDQHIAVHGRLVRRLAARLQRVLLARQKRHWQYDLEEGQLDSARLSRIISDPLMPLCFKAESDITFRDTTITLLIDNSRSMLGRPIMIAAACADILARTLERCGVSVEILGFTTVHLHGGNSTARWEQQGSPANPGRLNDLRHIVYKSADMPYRSARRNLGLMLDKDILKQNIDGESLMWAYQRLMKRPEERRILMTISDGAPVDTSTLGANAGDYLALHLQNVVDEIEDAERIELMAIGIGHDVSRFYSHAVSIFDARQLGPVMLDKLEKLFRQAA